VQNRGCCDALWHELILSLHQKEKKLIICEFYSFQVIKNCKRKVLSNLIRT